MGTGHGTACRRNSNMFRITEFLKKDIPHLLLEFPSHGGAAEMLSRHCIKAAFVGRKRRPRGAPRAAGRPPMGLRSPRGGDESMRLRGLRRLAAPLFRTRLFQHNPISGPTGGFCQSGLFWDDEARGGGWHRAGGAPPLAVSPALSSAGQEVRYGRKRLSAALRCPGDQTAAERSSAPSLMTIN